MSDYVYCLHSPSLPGLIRIESSTLDPYSREPECRQRLRIGLNDYSIAWAVRVTDGLAAEAAIKRALADVAHDDEGAFFRCDPLTARAEAVRFSALRLRPGRPGGKGHAA